MAKLCSNDEHREVIIGNAEKETIHEIWHGRKMNEIRKQHEKHDGFLALNVCRKCYYPRKAIADEQAFIGGREIWVENYVNRKQKIGK